MKCPICKKEFRPGPYAQHMKAHLRRGEVERREMVRPEHNVTQYAWSSPVVYIKVKPA